MTQEGIEISRKRMLVICHVSIYGIQFTGNAMAWLQCILEVIPKGGLCLANKLAKRGDE